MDHAAPKKQCRRSALPKQGAPSLGAHRRDSLGAQAKTARRLATGSSLGAKCCQGKRHIWCTLPI
eukprot:CAMPEP_0171163046 /NCGR_PEP_ID=MMETSP0790-20130122/4922_1 /TAXON_ID=2925 /ORGANISM="Alexandrium catenella, Strain OF101" /LENGTH=64 /DNA_ID=CAMNT_0011627701 /DNA_START=42 /DNA_END=236 /DNA_ORIENTATION=+